MVDAELALSESQVGDGVVTADALRQQLRFLVAEGHLLDQNAVHDAVWAREVCPRRPQLLIRDLVPRQLEVVLLVLRPKQVVMATLQSL